MKRFAIRFFVILFAFGAICYAAQKEDIQTLELGAKAPDFTLPGVDGKKYSLEDFSDAKILVIVFTCNHCPTAQAYEGRLKQLVKDYKDKGVQLVAISPNDPEAVRLDELGYTDLSDSFEEMKIRAEHKNFNFPYLYDGENQKVSKKYGPVATPHVFIFDQDRKLRFVGRIDNSEHKDRVTTHDTRNALNALLAGEEVPVKKTKVFGCSIKWASKRDSVKQAFERWSKEEVTLESIGKNKVKELIQNDSDKLRLINIWATFCGPCVAEFPELVTINRMYRHRAFELITISADDLDSKKEVLSFLKEKEASNQNYIFDSGNIYELVDTVDKGWEGAIPYTLLVKPGGEVVYKQMGMINPLKVKRLIVKHMPGGRR